MNCKPGDLAIIVDGGSYPEVIGKIIKCESLDEPSMLHGPMWFTDGSIFSRKGKITAIADKCLKPLRDNPGQDETLNWLPVPTKETV